MTSSQAHLIVWMVELYVLLNTPEELISPWEEPKDYSLIDAKYRIKEFHIEYDPELIEKLKARVWESREIIKSMGL